MAQSSRKPEALSRGQFFLNFTFAVAGLVVLASLVMLISRQFFSSPTVAFFRSLRNATNPTSEFDEAVQRLIDEGEPVSLDELFPDQISDSENANYHILEAAWLQFDPTDKKRSAKKRNYATRIAERLGKPGLCSDRDDIENRTQLALERAASCNQSSPLLRSRASVIDGLTTLWRPLRREAIRFSDAVDKENYKLAAEIALRQFGFIKAVRAELGVGADACGFYSTRNLFKDLNEVLRLGVLSDELLDQIDAELNSFVDASPHLIQKAREARAEYIADIQRKGKTKLEWAFLDQMKMLGLYEHQISLAMQPYFQVKDQFHPQRPKKATGKDVAYWNYEHTFDERHARWNFIASQARCLRILVAMEKYKNLHKIESVSVEAVKDLKLPADCLRATIADSSIAITQKRAGWFVTWKWDDPESGLIGYPPNSVINFGKGPQLPAGCMPKQASPDQPESAGQESATVPAADDKS